MDKGDKDNEGEESGNEEWRREGQYDTHTHEAGNSPGRQILWAYSPPHVGREGGRERAEGDTRVSGGEEREAVDGKTTRQRERGSAEKY